MKEYEFVIHYMKDGRGAENRQTGKFSCDADAKERGREILREAKRDVNAHLVTINRIERRHVVSYC